MTDYKERYQEAKKLISEQKKVIKKQDKFIEKLCLKLADKNNKALFHDKRLLAALRGEAAFAAEPPQNQLLASLIANQTKKDGSFNVTKEPSLCDVMTNDSLENETSK